MRDNDRRYGRNMVLWAEIAGRGSLLIDAAFLLVFSAITILANLGQRLDDPDSAADPEGKNADSMRSAAIGALTVVGILLPVMLLTLQLRAGENGSGLVSTAAIVDVVVASIWLLLSATFGLYVVFVSVFKGRTQNVLFRKDLAILFGLQLIFLLAGIFRAVWAVWSVAAAILQIP